MWFLKRLTRKYRFCPQNHASSDNRLTSKEAGLVYPIFPNHKELWTLLFSLWNVECTTRDVNRSGEKDIPIAGHFDLREHLTNLISISHGDKGPHLQITRKQHL